MKSGAELITLIPCSSNDLSLSQAKDIRDEWGRRIIAKEFPEIKNAHVIFCLDAPSKHIESTRRTRKVNFWGRGSYCDYIDAEFSAPKKLSYFDSELRDTIDFAAKSFQGNWIACKKGLASEQELIQKSERQKSTTGFFEQKLSLTNCWGTYTIFALCLALFVATEILGGSTNIFTLIRFGANYYPLTVENHQWWRLIAAMFLHIGYIHILVNMAALLIVGPRLERIYGNSKYLAL